MFNVVNINGFEITEKKLKSSFGEQDIEIIGVADINNESYKVTYQRTEPRGYVRITKIELPKITTGNTLCTDVIEPGIQEYLNG